MTETYLLLKRDKELVARTLEHVWR